MAKGRKNKSYDLTPLARNLSALMKEHGVGVMEMARIACVPKSTVQNWISGTNPTEYEGVMRICDHFAVTLSWLLTGKIESHVKAHSLSEVLREAEAPVFEGIYRINITPLYPATHEEE